MASGLPSDRSAILDLIYHFVFDDITNPTKAQIYPEMKFMTEALTHQWMMDFEMHLMVDGDPDFPGSYVWLRSTWVATMHVESAAYKLVQVIDEKGDRIEPAFSKFVEYQESPEVILNGNVHKTREPGQLWYREITNFTK